MLPVKQKLKFANCVFVVYGVVIGAAKTGLDPTATLSEFKVVHSIAADGEPIPGNPGIPAG